MNYLIADIIRGIVTNTMFVIILLSMVEPKYNKKLTWLFISLIMAMDLAACVYFYIRDDYTTVTKINVILLVATCFLTKPLFKESFMQWMFNFFSIININATIIILSYFLCGFFGNPYYSVIVIRFIMFGGVYFILKKLLKPLYRKAIEHWKVYFLLSLGIFINLMYYMFFNNDIKQTLSDNVIPLSLIIIFEIFAYISIFYSLKSTASEYELRAYNIKSQAQQKLLQAELTAYDDFVNLSKQNRHDIRHHNSIIAEYLADGNIEGARKYLADYDEGIARGALKEFCKNSVANAIFRLYERRTREVGIDFILNVDIPEELILSGPELGIVISNLLENAFENCKTLTIEKSMTCSCVTEEDSLRLEIRNKTDKEIVFNGDYPVSTKENGGTGIRSVANIIKKHGGMFRFVQVKNEYIAQIILPLH